MVKKTLYFGLSLVFAPACDDAYDDGIVDDAEGAVAPRCVGAGCDPIGGLGNTSRIGDHALTNAAKDIKVAAVNLSATNAWLGGEFVYREVTHSIQGIEVRPNGELRLSSASLTVGGEDTKGARLSIAVKPFDQAEAPFVGELLIADVACASGTYAPSVTICSYTLVTDVLPTDKQLYPQYAADPTYFHTCPNEDEGGTLSAKEKYRSVFSDGATFDLAADGTPRIHLTSDQFIIGCINGAVSKTQYKLNAFYDPTAYRGMSPEQATPALLAWMAWFDGRPRTVPGRLISLRDPINKLFDFTSDPEFELEAAYTKEGAGCRGHVHRDVPDPKVNIINWDQLPMCSGSDLDSHKVIGVKVIPAK